MKLAFCYSPFEQNEAVLNHARSIVKALKPKTLEVVYVVSPSETGLSLAFDIKPEDRFKKYPLDLLKSKLKRAKIPFTKITLLTSNSVSTSQHVELLAGYAKKSKFDFTIISTHARKGMDRFFQGSFAETFILKAKSNLLVYNPATKPLTKIKKLTFAHDNSSAARKNLRELSFWAKKINAKIEVIYVAEPSYETATDAPLIFIDQYRQILSKKIDHLKKEVKALGPHISLNVDDSWDSISNILIKKARTNKSDLIVVNSKVGGFIAALGGSISRQVVRRSEKTVLVLTGS